ncbi:MAG TPA: hypothetical protein VFR08_08225 [Candidatus Angelobacter sp.]|nr:hypothetical protein [Candidatus Angelobacter sp.]
MLILFSGGEDDVCSSNQHPQQLFHEDKIMKDCDLLYDLAVKCLNERLDEIRDQAPTNETSAQQKLLQSQLDSLNEAYSVGNYEYVRENARTVLADGPKAFVIEIRDVIFVSQENGGNCSHGDEETNMSESQPNPKGASKSRIKSGSQEVISAAIKGEYSYAKLALVLGLSCIIGGVILGLHGVTGHTSWTAKVLGLESQVSDAAPGVVLFIVGIFLIWITRPRVKMRDLKG